MILCELLSYAIAISDVHHFLGLRASRQTPESGFLDIFVAVLQL